jgi:hypothetical protein
MNLNLGDAPFTTWRIIFSLTILQGAYPYKRTGGSQVFNEIIFKIFDLYELPVWG